MNTLSLLSLLLSTPGKNVTSSYALSFPFLSYTKMLTDIVVVLTKPLTFRSNSQPLTRNTFSPNGSNQLKLANINASIDL